MTFPSIKSLTTRLNLSKDQAKQLRALFDAKIRYARNVRETDVVEVLTMANEFLGFYGVEHLCLPDGTPQCADGSDIELSISYANSGDTYTTTLLCVNGNFRIGNWGAYAEKF